MTRLTDHDLYLFNEGTHYRIFEKLGSHLDEEEGVSGVRFGVWAPDADRVSVVGDFNGWQPGAHPLAAVGGSGIWGGFVRGLGKGTIYKYHVQSRFNGYRVDKADPYAVHHETPPKTASVVWDLDYVWGDGAWMAKRREGAGYDAPLSIYEVHLGSWRRDPAAPNRFLTYRELAETLPAYVAEMGFTHVEFLPVMEHPFYGSWGYQVTGFFAPTSRYGTPQDFMHLIDRLHRAGVEVILDWVPSHFPTDEHGPGFFDGTHLFEHSDPRQGFHPDWKSSIFNYGRNEVRSFLLSNAMFWLERYHADGLRVDAVASMLYLDYSRKAGEWVPNVYGGRENLEAIDFLRRLNKDVYEAHADAVTVAEESTSWPMVSRPLYVGGLGFGYKWDMGWMHDTLRYVGRDPVFRKYHHNELTFRMLYAWFENFVLPLSHDEVVHGKSSLIGKMPGDEWRKRANLRLLFGYMYGQAAKKLLFMGSEIGQWAEWNHDRSLDWHLLEYPAHRGIQRWVRDLNHVYRSEKALHELDCHPDGFEWVDCNDSDQSVVALLRRGRTTEDLVVVACNFTPVPRPGYRLGVPRGGRWEEILNSDADVYGGSGYGNYGGVEADHHATHGRPFSISVALPPLAAVFFRSRAPGNPPEAEPETTEDASAPAES
jgi:1,4-alpha-glucan branching enzyme